MGLRTTFINSVIPKLMVKSLVQGSLTSIALVGLLSGLPSHLMAGSLNNIRVVSENVDFDGEMFSNSTDGCGYREFQQGGRQQTAVLFLTGSDFWVRDGAFDCSLQSTVFVDRAVNLVIENISSSRGSDNPIELRDSFTLVKGSFFRDSFDNKCVEVENGISIFFENEFSNCRNGFDMELTKLDISVTGEAYSLPYSAAIFLNNKFSKIRDDVFHCHDRTTKGRVFLFLKGNKISGQPGYTLRKFGKRKSCVEVLDISKELERAIRYGDVALAVKLVRDAVESSM